jgi:hypothetical protein
MINSFEGHKICDHFNAFVNWGAVFWRRGVKFGTSPDLKLIL